MVRTSIGAVDIVARGPTKSIRDKNICANTRRSYLDECDMVCSECDSVSDPLYDQIRPDFIASVREARLERRTSQAALANSEKRRERVEKRKSFQQMRDARRRRTW
jgi:hypothetical protein